MSRVARDGEAVAYAAVCERGWCERACIRANGDGDSAVVVLAVEVGEDVFEDLGRQVENILRSRDGCDCLYWFESGRVCDCGAAKSLDC